MWSIRKGQTEYDKQLLPRVIDESTQFDRKLLSCL